MLLTSFAFLLVDESDYSTDEHDDSDDISHVPLVHRRPDSDNESTTTEVANTLNMVYSSGSDDEPESISVKELEAENAISREDVRVLARYYASRQIEPAPVDKNTLDVLAKVDTLFSNTFN